MGSVPWYGVKQALRPAGDVRGRAGLLDPLGQPLGQELAHLRRIV